MQDEEPTSSGANYQTVTLVPSENSNGELSYVLIVQEETQQPTVTIDIKVCCM